MSTVLRDSPFSINRAAAPALIVMILAMMILPLPPFMLDLFFTFNIALAIIILLVSLSTLKPLDFSAFPTVLLITTLLRLSLNVASTRIVLLEGHKGGDAAGKVIEAFGHFLIGGNYAVGVVVFIILVIINFVVITKGAGRIAEVAARFTLDAMPGKQMAIDADLNAGLIGEDAARKRRAEIAQEADFYGAMDGASKFVRGDAIAGIIIMIVNVVGGLAIGVLQHGLDLQTAATNYTLLAIGDGLVAQVPALIISTAAGLVVSRVGTEEDLSHQLIGQVFQRNEILYFSGGILGIAGLIPGMPHIPFLLMSVILCAIAYYRSDQRNTLQLPLPVEIPPEKTEAVEVSWADVAPIDILGLEVGYRLIPLVDKAQEGELLRRIRGIRKKIAQDLGFLAPPVHIRDNLELRPSAYRILLKGVEIGSGEVFTGQFLAINPGRVLGNLVGTQTTDPAFGLPATWVDASQRDQAQALGYTVVDVSTVVATHLSNLVHAHAAELLGREETQQLVDHTAKESPKLIEDLIPKQIPLTTVQKVLQNLLGEGVHIRDIRTIIGSMAEIVTRTQDPEELTAHVRMALGRAIMHGIFGNLSEYPVMVLAPQLEQLLSSAMQVSGPGKTSDVPGLEPSLADTLLRQTAAGVRQQEDQGLPAVLMVPPALRTLLSRFLKRVSAQLRVVSQQEVPEGKSVRITTVIGG